MKGEQMSASERFAKRIAQINGVKYFVLARKDGHLITHNLSDPDDLAAMTTLLGLQTEEIRSTFGFTGFRHLVLTRTNRENLLLFQIDKYYLSVIHKAEADPEPMTLEINTFLKSLTRQPKTG